MGVTFSKLIPKGRNGHGKGGEKDEKRDVRMYGRLQI